MTTSQEYRHHGSQIILASLELCVSILKNTRRPNRNPLLTSVWSKKETVDLVSYLYQRRGKISEGSFSPGTFSDLAAYLNRRYPRSHRTRNLVLSRFALLKDDIAIIDRFNAVHGGGMDPSIIFVADNQAFNMYLLTIPDRDREVLERYRDTSFPNYAKLKAILHCIESTSLGLPSRHEALSPAVECHPANIQLPNQLPRSLSSDSSVSSCQQGSGAHDGHPAPSLSIHSPSTSASAAIQQSGPRLPAALFDALESQQFEQSADAVQLSADDQQPRDPTLLLLSGSQRAHSAARHSTLSLPSGLESIAMTSRASSKRRHVDDEASIFNGQFASPAGTSIEQYSASSRSPAKHRRVDEAAIIGGQSSCLEMTPIETVAAILDSVEALAKIIRQPPPPPSPLTFCILAAKKATNALSANCSLSVEQKVRLRWHFCRNPVEAASLPEDNALLDTIFQDMIKRLGV